jgi:hypothetical protein
MKKYSILYLSLLGWLLTSCNAIYGIFKTGVGFGVIITVAIVIGIIILVNRMKGGGGKQE